MIQRQFDLADPSRLVWNSNMPNVERNCTYRQSLEYLPRVLDETIRRGDLELILDGSMARLIEFS